MRTAIVTHAIEPAALVAEVESLGHGAVLLFLGTVRDVNDGRAVTAIEYQAYEAMAEHELAAIVAEAAHAYGTAAIVVEHRTGRLALGEVSVAIALSHAHRGPAYDASRFIIEELKRRLPVWKREEYLDGALAWVDPSGRPAPEVTR